METVRGGTTEARNVEPEAAEAAQSRPALARFGEAVARRAWAVVGAWVVLLVIAGAVGAGTLNRLTTDSGMDESSESFRAYQVLTGTFPGRVPDLTILYSSAELTVDDPAFRAAVTAAVAKLPRETAVHVVNGLDAPPAEAAASGLVSPDRHAVKVVVSLPPGTDAAGNLADFDRVRPHVDTPDPRVRADVSGIAAMGRDILDQTAADTARAEAIALPIVFVLSLLIFGGLVAAALPTLVGAVAIVLSVAVLRGITEVAEVATQALMVVTLLGMGLAIDYSLFVISRFREELAGRRGREAAIDALTRTLPTAGRTVLFSALVVAVALSGLLVFPIATVRSMAYGAIPAVLGCALAAVTLLPAVLALLGHRIDALPILPGARRRGTPDAEHEFWAGVAHHVMRRPWAYLIGTTALLLALTAPILGVRWGGVGEELLPADAPSRVALAQEARHFGGESTWGYAMVTGADRAALTRYAGRLAAAPGVANVVPTLSGADADGEPVTMLTVTWPGHAQSQDSKDLVAALREIDPDSGQAVIGGPTAITLDTVRAMGDRLPAMLAVMVGAMLVLLGVAFASVVLPVKAVLMSAISIGASYGVLTWVFQDGHGSGLLGFDPPGYLDVTTPIVMMAILFGLSMDYEVFLLSRIREEWLRTGDNTAAVARGLARTGRLITGAALLLAVVIGAFATSDIVIVTMLGVGMLVAVLLDATVVRGLLVPATMRLLGHWNWWLPGQPRQGAVPP